LVNKPLVSVIVPTYNSSSTLEPCLSSMRLQTYQNIEIMIVDNYSADDTVKIAKKYDSIIVQVKALRSAARNYGAKKARGDFFFFVDADMELTPSVVEECLLEIVKGNSDAIMIPEIRIGEGFWAKSRAIERQTYIGDPLIESARFFRKKAFDKVSGYDEELEAGEDWDLHARIEDAGYKVGRIDAFMKHREGRITLASIAMKRYRYGKTLTRYIRKHPERARIQFMPIRLNYIRHWRSLARDPVPAAGFLVMKAIEYFVVMISIVVSELTHKSKHTYQ